MAKRQINRLFALLFAIVLVALSLPASVLTATASTTEFAGGSGTEADPYLIATKDHLNNVRNHLGSHYKFTADIIFLDSDFDLGGPFYNNGRGWCPIGDHWDSVFSGVIDGNGYSIVNLQLFDAIYNGRDAGLVGFNSGTIKNLTIKNSALSIKLYPANLGCFVGENLNKGLIENCAVVDSRIAASSGDAIGGIVGHNHGEVKNCTNNSNIIVNTGSDVGGICGQNGNHQVYTNVITNCFNSGNITGGSSTGGIVGYNADYGIVELCANIGNVTVEREAASIGGIAGHLRGSIEKCYNTGTMSVTAKKSVNCGGIAGHNDSGAIANCYNTGNVSGTSTVLANHICIGGIVGRNRSVLPISKCYSIGGVSGAGPASLLFVGLVSGQNSTGTIEQCYYWGSSSSATGSGDSSSMYACSREQMKNQATFSNFDFSSVWTMSSTSYPYPELINNPHQCPNHPWDSGTITEQPTCKDAGVKTFTCALCDSTKTEAVGITDNHSYGGWTNASDTAHKHTCSVCQKEETANHLWNNGTVTKTPTCKEAGVRAFTCTGCGSTKTEAIGKLTTHTYGNWTSVNETTHKHTCSVCQKEETAAHTWNSGAATKKATCKESGVKTYTCTTCGGNKTESIAKLTTHTYDNVCDTTCNVCSGTRTVPHQYSNIWGTSKTEHWHECSLCGNKKDLSAHTPGAAATETTAQTCTTCGYIITPALNHTHNYSNTLSNNREGHWYACSGCSEQKDYAAHIYDNACDTDCNTCGFVRTISHNFSENWANASTTHWHTCTICGKKTGEENHVPGMQATETTAQTCTVCGYEIAPALGHTHIFGEYWNSDSTTHWKNCPCGEKSETAAHTLENGFCTVCGASASSPNQTPDTQAPTNAPTEPTEDQGPTSTPNEPTDNKKGEGGNDTVLIVVLSVVLVGGAAAAVVFILIKKGILTINVK